MSVVESARFMALGAIAINDALIAVLEAKYHYNFWRPVTAIRNGDLDGKRPPIGSQPGSRSPIRRCTRNTHVPTARERQRRRRRQGRHSEPPTFPRIATTSPTAPGVTHRWTSMTAFTDEVRECSHLVRLPLPLLDPRRDEIWDCALVNTS